MALISRANAVRQTMAALKKAPISGGVGLYSYKRNRKILVSKTTSKRFLFIEEGYIVSEIEVEESSIEKALQAAIKREFPRSRKIRLYRFDGVEDREAVYKKI